MSKLRWWIAGGVTLLMGIIVGLALAVTNVSTAFVPADPRWAAVATQQHAASVRTPIVVGAAPTRTPTAVRTVPATVAPISASDATATPTATPTAAPTTTPTAAPTAASTAAPTSTSSPSPTVTPEAETIPVATVTTAEATPPPVAPTLPVGVLATVGVPMLNLRTGPGLDFPIIASLPRGTAITVLDGREVADSYFWVEVVVDGRRGWLLGEPVGVR
ncbi:MAG TPA: SH3 domain-containing protein [Thermomicrobiales bacterium]